MSKITANQFNKQTRFLENNLGIEEDFKLGDVVEAVSTGKEKERAIVEDKEDITHLMENNET